ncbi:SDR family NAD(P)-dependent oxidoreductase [Nocardia yunnanensis]|uniref:SDR family NAD(P)-dependent oxidoreductase n=1 Tax=Nocardia yunnanensis TaxID=2382165 RepID=A0A386ZKY7_9NOCA|nr:short-chain dehydrogenase/reductase [Nocardia yunnanensis]AYF78241.1 SDR family NAD(P)-dependent oxidoreductase [Nocardia yunnanensis]
MSTPRCLPGPGPFTASGRVALITGAGQGIGRELAAILYRRGASVALVDIDAAAVTAAATALGERALPVIADVTDRAAMAEAIGQVAGYFGHLDIVVANAGVVPTPATLRTLAPAEFDRVLGINLTGVFNTVHPALDHIITARGHVAVVSSCAAFAPGMGGAPYMISKAAVEQLGRALRVELAAHGASAGVAYFGIVETEMTRATLDRDELGRRIEALLPWPLNTRITAAQAARTLADAIEHRAAQSISPRAWTPYALLRGVVNTVLDAGLARDPRVRALLREVERRSLENRSSTASIPMDKGRVRAHY